MPDSGVSTRQVGEESCVCSAGAVSDAERKYWPGRSSAPRLLFHFPLFKRLSGGRFASTRGFHGKERAWGLVFEVSGVLQRRIEHFLGGFEAVHGRTCACDGDDGVAGWRRVGKLILRHSPMATAAIEQLRALEASISGGSIDAVLPSGLRQLHHILAQVGV